MEKVKGFNGTSILIDVVAFYAISAVIDIIRAPQTKAFVGDSIEIINENRTKQIMGMVKNNTEDTKNQVEAKVKNWIW